MQQQRWRAKRRNDLSNRPPFLQNFACHPPGRGRFDAAGTRPELWRCGLGCGSSRSGSDMIEWFDDLRVGMRFKSPDMLVTREDIKRFAAEFDPQPYHLDEAAAERSPLNGLAASGWHTAAMAMRLAIETRPFGPHPLLGIGVDDLRWLDPVRPGDVIHVVGEVIEVTPSRSRPQGTVKVKWTAFNQNGTAVYTFSPTGIVPRRPSA